MLPSHANVYDVWTGKTSSALEVRNLEPQGGQSNGVQCPYPTPAPGQRTGVQHQSMTLPSVDSQASAAPFSFTPRTLR
jgi:hypothetical protein